MGRTADVPDEALTECRRRYGKVTADFVSRKEFGYSWRASKGGVEMHVSDYLEGAPTEMLSDFFSMVCDRAVTGRWREPQSYLDFVRSDDYIVSRRPVYVRRSRNLLRTGCGETAYLHDSVQRLLDSGLLTETDISNSYMSWTRRDSVRRVGFCSTMFRVVGISARLDSDDVPDSVRDYVVYHECLHLRQGYRPSNRTHDALFRSWERMYPRWSDAERFLRSLGGGR